MLNKPQLISLWLGVASITLMGLIPPWREAAGNGSPLAYAPLNSPPTVSTPLGVTIDFARLTVQWLVATVVTAGLLGTFQRIFTNHTKSSLKPAALAGDSLRDFGRTAGVVPSSQALDANNRAGESRQDGERVLVLPQQSLGVLFVESPEDEDYWEPFANAQGLVTVARNKRLQLEVDKFVDTDFGCLRDLPLDAFHSIDFSGTKVSDLDLENLKNLSALKELDLSDTQVSDLGIKKLADLSKLEKIWLDNTAATENSLKELITHPHLKKISMIGTSLNADIVQTLVKGLSEKCQLILK